MADLNGIAADLNQVTALALTNYGHFTSMRVDDNRVRGLSLHLERLVRDCHRVFDADLDPDRIRHVIRGALVDAPRSIVVRVTVFDPHLELGHCGGDAKPRLLVTTRPAALTPPPPLRLQTAQYRREMPAVKHVGLFEPFRRRRIAQRRGFDDAVFTDADAVISEASTSNIGFVDGGRIVWPQAEYLAGVTMQLINQAHDEHIATMPVTLADLAHVRAVFATNAAIGVRPVSIIDGMQWPDEDPVLDTLRRQYDEIPPELL
ncbi:MAG: aminotransferase class IV family protein [Pseudonocardiaceae bacterium]